MYRFVSDMTSDLALALFVARIVTNNVNPAFTTDNFTFDAAWFNGCLDFHWA